MDLFLNRLFICRSIILQMDLMWHIKHSSVNPYNAYVYGLLVDGNVEMGNYDTAVSYADKMVSVRPDLTSYSRVSYLREIFGDYAGSIKAMQMAVEAGGRRR